jgi:hypothetical protein
MDLIKCIHSSGQGPNRIYSAIEAEMQEVHYSVQQNEVTDLGFLVGRLLMLILFLGCYTEWLWANSRTV